MSAIFGLIRWDGKAVLGQDFEPILPKLSVYGSDKQAVWAEAHLGLGAYLSHLYPQDNYETQPLVQDGLILVADARLDKREELCQQLAIPHAERNQIPDSRLILMAYQRWGEVCVPHLLGDFAFALWDSHQQRLFAARDFIGARPFYYFQTKQAFGFSSDLSALLAFPDLELAIDEEEVFQAIVAPRPVLYYNPAKTYYRDIYRLPFAHQMTVQAGEIRLSQHWTGTQLPQIAYPSEADYAERTLELLQEAVASRISTKEAVGAHLSGGIDSSSVAIVAARLKQAEGKGLSVYSWSPPMADSRDMSSEQYRIEAICRQEALTCEYVPYRFTSRDDLSISNGQRMRIEQAVMRRAQAKQVRLMLSGWGGDEFISFNARGYRADLFASGKWRELYLSFRPFALEAAWFKHFLVRFWHSVALPLVPDALYPYFRHTEEIDTSALDDSCFEAAFLQRLKAAQAQQKPERYAIRGRLENQIRLFNNGHLTNRIEQWAAEGARHQMVYAYPLLDRRLVEFALGLPDKLYLQRGNARYLFRQATAALFPPEAQALIAQKGEPNKIAHGQVLKQMIAKQYRQEEIISEDIAWFDKNCLQARLKRLSSSEERHSLRAVALLNLWRDLQKEMRD